MHEEALRWHLYCRVVDNYGDIGVAWRLAADLADRNQSVQLFVNDTSALDWLVPSTTRQVEVRPWDADVREMPDVVVQTFGCGLPELAARRRAVHINVEYLSGEGYVERSHGLAAATHEGRATTWYFYPGFSRHTGGLLRELGLLEQRDAWREQQRQSFTATPQTAAALERQILLFAYDGAPVAELLSTLQGSPTRVLLPPGPARASAHAWFGRQGPESPVRHVDTDFVSQHEFDRLLWASDLNLVRGEDSFVRAIWAGAPFIWQLYPQSDGAHFAKLEAFLHHFLSGAEPSLATAVAAIFRRWNGAIDTPIKLPDFNPWRAHCLHFAARLAEQPDLTRQLMDFADLKRPLGT